jgi:hypothetical protein
MDFTKWQSMGEPHFRQYIPKQVHPMFISGSNFTLGGLLTSMVLVVVPIIGGIKCGPDIKLGCVAVSCVMTPFSLSKHTGIDIDNEGILL